MFGDTSKPSGTGDGTDATEIARPIVRAQCAAQPPIDHAPPEQSCPDTSAVAANPNSSAVTAGPDSGAVIASIVAGGHPNNARADAAEHPAPTPLPHPRRKILLVASSGGHWIELCRLKDAFADHECLYVSTSHGLTAPDGQREVSVITDSSRDSLLNSLRTIAGVWRIVRDFAPDVVVSTGAAPGAAALFAAKLIGAHTIWVDSIANGDELSLSGRLVRPVADLRLTQSEAVAQSGTHIDFFGRIM